MIKKVAVVRWFSGDEVSAGIAEELARMGYDTVCFEHDERVPPATDLVFSFGPWGRFLQIPLQQEHTGRDRRWLVVHWNTEDPPDLRIPWLIMSPLAAFRSWVDRLHRSESGRRLVTRPPFLQIDRKMHKFRYVGDYQYAYRKGLIDLYFESSEIYAEFHRQHGIPAKYVNWGTARVWYQDLRLERDIDVLWIGIRRTKRRSELLDRVRRELGAHGIRMTVVDGESNPFLFGHERIKLFNRAKVTLNLIPTWYDNNFPYRFHLAAGNRSLLVSEPFLAHCPVYQPTKHFVCAPPAELASTIRYYLEHDQERAEIVENAHFLATQELTLKHSVESIMTTLQARLQNKSHASA